MILARGQITITNEADILDSIKVGGRNLVPNGKGTYILRGDPDKFANRAYRRTPNVSISSDKSYCMGAYIEVVEGSPHAISAISYKYESRTLVHNPARALYDQSKGGKQWLTWIFLASDRERVEMDAIRIYAGEMGKTQGITIHISDVILIEGNIPPTSWIPAPEDVEDKAKELARIESARTLREQVSIERDRAYETYRKLRTDSRTPKDKGLALEQTWITANGAHANLYQSCSTFITTPTDANFGVIERRTREYKSAMISLQRSIQEVEQAIRERAYNEAKDKTRVKVEAKDLDPNKYYPLIIKLPKPYKDTRLYGIRIERPLYDKSLGVPPYATHTNGYTLALEWSVQAMGYGAQEHNRRTHSYQTKFLRDGERVVSAPNQEYRTSYEYVYLRGGSDVWVEFTGATDVDIAIYAEGLDLGSGYGNYRFEVLDSIAHLGEPKIDLDALKDNLMAEVTKTRTDLQGSIARAQEVSGEAFQREVQAVLANVSSLSNKLDETAGTLQRQIDKQVERWFGEDIARSGVPPTNLWAHEDNAKHEGDTYTCVAPKGVTITTTNAHEYPNVGKSWRWTNGGSGDAYGWVLIADTDITQALALASKAQATADGKMTHYTTATPPVNYQRGDQWTLPTAWQGRKDGRAYSYPAGSILTATANSVSGQHHPEHWAELVRYTDLSIDDIKVGGRNLSRDSKRRKVIAPSDTNRYNAMGYKVIPGIVSTHKSYAVSADVEVLAGDIDRITCYPYGAHTPQEARYDKAKGGVQRLTWVFEAELSRPEKQPANTFYIYAGVNGGTVGNSIAISELIVVEGNIPPSGWIPAPEDVEDKAKELARIESVRTLREQVSIERDRAYETYRKLRTDSRTPKDKGLALEQTWITANGAHANLYQSCNTFITTPTDANFGVIERRTREYKSAMISLQSSIQEVEQAIREQIYNKAQEVEAVNYLKAVLRKGNTRVEGGAVLGQYIAVADLEGIVHGYLSGRAGGVFLAAGVNDHGTERESRNVEIKHDGSGHFGQMHFRGEGEGSVIDFVRISDSKTYLSIGGSMIPIKQVLRQAEITDHYSISGEVAHPIERPEAEEVGRVSITHAGQMTYSMDRLTMEVSVVRDDSGYSPHRPNDTYVMPDTISVSLDLERSEGGAWVIVRKGIGYCGALIYNGQSVITNGLDSAGTIRELPAGTYRLVLRADLSVYSRDRVTAVVRVPDMSMQIDRIGGSRQVVITDSGVRVMLDGGKLVDISADSEYALTTRGAIDIGGILAAGRVRADGVVDISWGAYCDSPGYDYAKVDKNSDNSYTVHHSIGHDKYIVQLTTENTWDVATYYDVKPNSFKVRLQNHTQGMNRYFTNPFSYVCIGDNKGRG